MEDSRLEPGCRSIYGKTSHGWLLSTFWLQLLRSLRRKKAKRRNLRGSYRRWDISMQILLKHMVDIQTDYLRVKREGELQIFQVTIYKPTQKILWKDKTIFLEFLGGNSENKYKTDNLLWAFYSVLEQKPEQKRDFGKFIMKSTKMKPFGCSTQFGDFW